MQVSDVSPARVRRLAALRPEGAKVISVYLNLDPATLATGEARDTAINSIMDAAERQAEAVEVDRDARMALREDLERARRALKDLDAKGAHGVALFACGPAGLLELVKLPRPVDAAAFVGDAPHVEPLVTLAERERIAVAVVSRSEGRILVGTRDRLQELEPVNDDVHGQHSQGGWSQARYQRSVDNEAREHIERVFDTLLRRLRTQPFDRLLVASPDEVVHGVQEALHPYLAERYAGRISVDQSAASADDVLAAAQPVLTELDHRREREALDRLHAALGSPDGRGVSGLQEVLDVLFEQRVEVLLYVDGFREPGVIDPDSGWLGAAGAAPPMPGVEPEQVDDVLEPAVGAALLQSAEVLRVRQHADELDELGGIAALLRF